MKINKLLESSTPTSDASNITTSAPKFGRDDKALEETTAGPIATVASPVGKVRSRGSIFSGIKTSEKFPNTVDEDLADEGVFGIGSNKSQQKTPLDYKAVRQMSQQKGPNQKFYRPDEYVKQYGAFAEEQLDEVDPRNFDSDEDYYDAVRNQGKQKFSGDWDVWDEIASLENQLKYTKSSALAHTLHKQIDQLKSEYGIEDDEQLDEKSVSKAQFRTMAAVAHNPKFAKKVGISQKVGKEFHKADRKQDYEELPAKVDEESKGLWANIHAKRERIKSGSGERMRKPGSKGAPTAQNFKDAANEAANPAQQAAIAIAKKKEKGVAEGEAGNYYSIALQMYPHLKQFDRATVITALNNAYEDYLMHYGYEGIGPDEERSMINRAIKGLKKDVAEAGEWTKLPNGNWRNMHTGAQQSTPPKTKKPRRTMGLHASLEQHADDKMKELGHKFKPVDETRVGNRMSDISIGSPKIVHYKGKAVGEVGIDHEASPGNGPFYMKHYLTGKDMVGYDSKQQALADLKHLVMQYDGHQGVAEGLPQTLRKVVPGYAKREIDKKMDAGKFGKTDADKDANFQRYKKIQDKIKEQGVAEEKKRLDPKCWTGYKKQGTKMKGDTRVNNCVPIEEAELNEEDMLANELFKQLELFKKAQDKGIGAKPQDKGISTKAKDRDIISKDDGEYNDEAGMFKNDLQTIQRVSNHLEKAIQDNENLPEWCQAKIAQAKGMVVNVMDYMISQHENGIVDTLEEEFDLIESIVESIAVRNNVNSEAIWEDLESLTDDELYVFAVTSEPINEDWQKVNKKDKTDGMSPKAVKAYRRENPGSKLKTAVTTKPSKLKKGSKASKRRKSYCSRSRGQMKMHNISCSKTPDKAICKARRRWNC